MDRAPLGGKNRGAPYRSRRFHHDRPKGAKKNQFKPHLSKYWKIPPDGSAAFVVCMEDVLDNYHLPYDPRFPLVCMDESNKQLVGEVAAPIPQSPRLPLHPGQSQDGLVLETPPQLTRRRERQAPSRRMIEDFCPHPFFAAGLDPCPAPRQTPIQPFQSALGQRLFSLRLHRIVGTWHREDRAGMRGGRDQYFSGMKRRPFKVALSS